MKNSKLILSLFLIVLMASCYKQEFHNPLYGDEGAPGPISNAVVKNIPGGAIIEYTLPDNENLLYVKAKYERQGKIVESKSSFYKKSILVEGLGDTLQREVKLYTVSRSEELSEPVSVIINPLAPAIQKVLSSLQIKESFGGMNINFQNPESTGEKPYNIVIGIVGWDSTLNEWQDVDAYYTGLSGGNFSVRGLAAVKRKFGFFVKDTWDNITDTIVQELTPIYEEQIDGSKITYAKGKFPVPQIPPLPIGGGPVLEPGNLSSWPFDHLFDGEIGNNGFHSNEKNPIPAWFAMDLGKTIRLSRYKLWQRNSNGGYLYSHGNPHEWEIWGTNTPNDVNSWVLLDHEIMVKPSGLPIGQVSNDDVAVAELGHEYEFPLTTPAVRYIGWKLIDNWASIQGATGFMHISELRFWGQIQ
jgi:hypothetical protein